MLRNYFLIALRNLKRRKTFTLFNLLGMALGMAGFTLFAHMSGVKLNADRFHRERERIYGVVQKGVDESGNEVHTALNPAPLQPALLEAFPDIESGIRVRPMERVVLRREDDGFFENGGLLVDQDFFRLFSFRLTAGNPETALARPASIVISRAMALKYFGDEDPLGQTLILGRDTPLTVTGILHDVPRTSSLRFHFLVPLESAPAQLASERDDWGVRRTMLFLLLSDPSDRGRIQERFSAFLDRTYPDGPDRPESMYLFPYKDFRLKSRHITSYMSSSHPAYAYFPLALGVLLLVAVSINFINLAAVRSLHRAREVGLRKVAGANRLQLILQFLGESVLLAGLAFPAAVIFYELLHPVLTSYMGSLTQLGGVTSDVSNSIFNYPYLLKYMAGAALLTGLFSGLYPAFFLSAFRPVRVLKGSVGQGRRKRRGSKALVVFQFTLSVLFIASAWIIRRQSDAFRRADLGFDGKGIAALQVPAPLRPRLDALRGELLSTAGVERVTGAAGIPLVWSDDRPVRPPDRGAEQAVMMDAYGVDFGFVEALDLKLIQGRGFARESGDRDGFVLNRTAADRLGWDLPLGRELVVGDRSGRVIGVVEDFLFDDIGFRIPPALLYLETESLPYLLVEFGPGVDFTELRERIKTRWRELAPGLPLTSFTLEEHFEFTWQLIDRLAGFLGAVGTAVVLFAGLGLLGLASYLVEGRTKEIGIRRILGASLPGTAWLIVREFLVLVLLADLISLFLVHFGWREVLKSGLLFLTPVGAAIPLSVGALTILIALAAVGYQTMRTALTDPVKCLRYE